VAALAALAVVVIAPAAATAQRRAAARAGMDAERLMMIPARMKSSVERGTMAGAVMLVARRGEVASLEAVGFQDVESKKPMRPDTIFDTRSVTNVTERPVHQGFGWGLSGDPLFDFPLTSKGSFGHNGAFGAIIWIDPQKQLIRIFLEHRLGFHNESNLFMAMAGSAVVD
jgi:CubicO group peptidase (beta-lactamase class C family)